MYVFAFSNNCTQKLNAKIRCKLRRWQAKNALVFLSKRNISPTNYSTQLRNNLNNRTDIYCGIWEDKFASKKCFFKNAKNLTNVNIDATFKTILKKKSNK